ncbi:hypothetical protein FPANT_6856 [Fusarium pseudoanthophilum]|uniref:Uncharacterized protein n=1 Tax=Fusarium pseudoanthophilum TaxID=48495 RepID=A0A8H5P1K0_9HYPO|nr:hypothetical protein FPANT_6856 [Fusarium pseudoanthophilum]
MSHPLQTETAPEASVTPTAITITSPDPKPNPIYLRCFLRYAIGAAATSTNDAINIRIMKLDPVLMTYTLIPMAQSRLRKPGDIEVVVATLEEMEKMPERFGSKITKETTTRTGPSLAEFPVFGYTVPEFGDLKDQGLEVLAWRVYGSGDKKFMDADGYGLPAVSGMIQAWFDRM